MCCDHILSLSQPLSFTSLLTNHGAPTLFFCIYKVHLTFYWSMVYLSGSTCKKNSLSLPLPSSFFSPFLLYLSPSLPPFLSHKLSVANSSSVELGFFAHLHSLCLGLLWLKLSRVHVLPHNHELICAAALLCPEDPFLVAIHHLWLLYFLCPLFQNDL